MAKRGGGRSRSSGRRGGSRRAKSGRGARRSGFQTGRSVPIRGSGGRFAGSKSIGSGTLAPGRKSLVVQVKRKKYIVVKKSVRPFTKGQARSVAARIATNQISGGGPLGRPVGRTSNGVPLRAVSHRHRTYVIGQIGA